ncbi:MAG: DUF3105 domain-containing protein [Polyangiales bacterium]
MRFPFVMFAAACLFACGNDKASTNDDDGSAIEERDRDDLVDGGAPDSSRDGGGARDAGMVDETACIEGAAEEHQPDAGAMHVSRFRDSELVYEDVPPTGGTHSECWADFTIYEEELEDARWVHNLEHGGIVLLYRCDGGCPNELASLRSFAKSHPRTILTPYAALPTRFAAVAWEYRLLNNCLELPAIQQFYDDHFNRAREDSAGGPPDLCR